MKTIFNTATLHLRQLHTNTDKHHWCSMYKHRQEWNLLRSMFLQALNSSKNTWQMKAATARSHSITHTHTIICKSTSSHTNIHSHILIYIRGLADISFCTAGMGNAAVNHNNYYFPEENKPLFLQIASGWHYKCHIYSSKQHHCLTKVTHF